jgi:hypothetical protein
MEFGLQAPTVGSRTGSKKFPGVISYRTTPICRPQSVNPMESSSVYEQMDRQSADNTVFFQNLKIR